MSLIIVESPTKARTFNRLLKGKDYFVFATMGHFRDLPAQRMAINFFNNFQPEYKILANKQKIVDKLKELAKVHKEVILATDLDREGESISYHSAFVLGFIEENWPDFKIKNIKNLKRIVFHEITNKALQEALKNPSEVRINLIKAQQARRILDRVVGYELSPLLWKKIGKNWLSAGRVQTVALRLIVEREKEITKFAKEKYHQIYGIFSANEEEVKAKLLAKNDHVYETKNKVTLFDGDYTYSKTDIDNKKAEEIKQDLIDDKFKISDIKEETIKRYPPPPLTTSLLQQEGFRRYGFSAKLTMKLAQNLYEQGYITYHRTDSFQLSSYFVFKAKDYIEDCFGKEYALEKPRGFITKSKSAQEAHEAIRPTHLNKDPKKIKTNKSITSNHRKLYDLIFIRSVATQMKEAEISKKEITIKSKAGYIFEAVKEQVIFDGFFKILNPAFVERRSVSLNLKAGDLLSLKTLEDQELDTLPPPRYNEASLIKAMEEKGIGRPSTYAPIISLIQDKYYVEKEQRYFLPTQLGFAISDYLSASFTKLFDLNFTAKMEEDLDKVASGELDFIDLLKDFYSKFDIEVKESKKDQGVIDVEEKNEGICDKCGGHLVLRYSKFGKFLGCKNYPKCKFVKSYLYIVKNRFCPDCKGRIVSRFSKSRKKFYGCENYPKCKFMSWKLPPMQDSKKEIKIG